MIYFAIYLIGIPIALVAIAIIFTITESSLNSEDIGMIIGMCVFWPLLLLAGIAYGIGWGLWTLGHVIGKHVKEPILT